MKSTISLNVILFFLIFRVIIWEVNILKRSPIRFLLLGGGGKSVSNDNMIITENSNVFKLESDFPDLFSYLITKLPAKINGWNSKDDFHLRFERETALNLHSCKWIEYNQKWLSVLVIDIDKGNLGEAIEKASELDFEPSFGCSTDKGAHLFFVLENVVKYEWEKMAKYARDVKQALTYYLGGDMNGSHRLKGIWRNPLRHEFYYSHGAEYSLDDFRELCVKFRNKDKKPKEKFEQYRNNARRFNNAFNFEDGNRNAYLFYFGMLYSRGKDYTLEQTEDLVDGLQDGQEGERLDLKEVKHIAKNVFRYNEKGMNFITRKTLKNEGVMEFPKISNLTADDYEKEVKHRQRLGAEYTNEKLKNDKEKLMTRVENAKKLGKDKEERVRRDIQNFISGMFADDYKKKNGKWNAAKIAKTMGKDAQTVRKHLKALGEI